MRISIVYRATLCALVVALAACNNDTSSATGDAGPASSGAASGTSGITSSLAAPVALSAATYTVAATSQVATVRIYRQGNSTGAATVSYSTANGTAMSGSDYQSTEGTVTWSDGEVAPKSIQIPVMTNRGWGKHFFVTITSVSGDASIGSPATATVALSDPTSSSSSSSSSSSGGASSSSSGGSPSSSSSSSGGKSSSSSSSSSSGAKSSSSSGSSSSGASTAAPAPAAAVGYNTETFGPAVTLGSNWYNYNFYGESGTGGKQNTDGSVLVPGSGATAISSARQDTSKPNAWAGTAFGGGGYFEATFSFTGASNNSLSAWPSYWANDIENMSQNSVTSMTQWPGQAQGYGNWIETDFFEYDHSNTGQYGVQIHNWYGKYGAIKDVTSYGAGINVPAGFKWSDPHKFGFLWVPASSGVKGYAKNFLDGVQVGPTIYWDEYSPGSATPPPPAPGSTAVSVLDTRHLALIFQTGTQNPMTIYAVSVWQASAAHNIKQ